MNKEERHNQVVKSVFCAQCVWAIGKFLMKEPFTEKQDVAVRQHYLNHLDNALKIIVTQPAKRRKK